MNQHTYDNLIYDKRDKYIQWTRYSLFNKWCCKMWTATCKRMKSRTFPNNIHKNKLKMDYRPKGNSDTNKTLGRKYRQNTVWHKMQQDLF